METKRYGLSKKERISSKKEIDLLFTGGNSFVVYPLRIVYVEHHCEEISDESAVSIMVNIPKKKFRRAVKRNRLKRMIKESYRLNKTDLIGKMASCSKRISIAFLYLPDNEKTYPEIASAVREALKTLSMKILKND